MTLNRPTPGVRSRFSSPDSTVDSKTVREVCATLGTADALGQSHQVEGAFTRKKTGLGNMRELKKTQIEHT